MRKSHVIKRNHKTENPKNIIFFDTETKEIQKTNEKELVLKLGVACQRIDRKNIIKYKWIDFKTPDEFWRFVFKNTYLKTKTYLIAHNVAFDFRVVKGFEFMKSAGYKINKLIYNGTTNIWDFSIKDKSICVLDNMNFFKSSLAKLGESIGIPKMIMPKDNDASLLLYCRNDVFIMVEAWEKFFKFLKDNDLGNFAKTIAGQALGAYRHRFMKENIYVHTCNSAIEMERKSYHGGRTECFFIGKKEKENFYLLDVNSMYPSVMRENEYPTKLIGIYHKYNLEDKIKSFAITADVSIKTDKPIFPVNVNDKLIFPVGEYKTILTTREIEYALKNNLITEVRNYCVYEKHNLFKNYVDFFYNKRLEYKKQKNDAFSFICKLFLNSLYGKFGQRNEKFEKISNNNNDINDGIFKFFDLDNETWITERRISGRIERSAGLQEGRETFVAIASHITADARMKLWSYFELAGRENIFYTDTDSMIVNQKGYNNSISKLGPELGMLSLKDTANMIEIRGLKDYSFGENETIKGIRKDAIKITDDLFSQTKFEGIAGAIRKNRMNKMFISEVRKKLYRMYDKGIVLSDGKIIPIHVSLF